MFCNAVPALSLLVYLVQPAVDVVLNNIKKGITWFRSTRAGAEKIWKSSAIEIGFQPIRKSGSAACVECSAISTTWTNNPTVTTLRLEHLAYEIL